METIHPNESSYRQRVIEVMQLFLRLGITAFGGPAAHIAIMRDEVVKRRKWISEQDFLDLFGAANLIPGPTSTEMAIYLGFRRVGWIGLVLGGVCFILPAMLIVLALAWAYVRFGTTSIASGILYGILPVVIAIIAQALWNMSKNAVKGWLTAIVGLIVLALYFLNVNILMLLLAAGLVMMLIKNLSNMKQIPAAGFFPPLIGLGIIAGPVPFGLMLLFLTFLKIGAILYGSGYVLLAFLHADLVQNLGWLTERQLFDAIAIGQITPGPLFTTATFIGYLLGGLPGALLATLGIFLPSFFFVGISSLFIKQIRNSPWTGGFLDGVNVASLALMLAVTLQLSTTAIVDPLTIGIALVSLVVLLRFKPNSTWLIAGGALIGFIHTLM
ncbi:MAG: chromate efflux transporter [Chloroflexi bacterium]|nr:chromate efflux transporter [Chloroflexota bacterium]